jgi:hypothetical protein
LWAVGAYYYVTPAASMPALNILGNVKKWAECTDMLPGIHFASTKKAIAIYYAYAWICSSGLESDLLKLGIWAWISNPCLPNL